ncbi:hypothetical protein HPP92_023700 [Vanilla planifolia]|uniref:Myb/SANT-like DNA-binding domain-containing protein n=1 Tax=Vanilla planifolia TaxID=51239 RepID=A0A835PQT2_VANPL|nr:hypothetical protein HPP92_024042 [Vanilla planifolia]KAG0455912.1 hypothetical protein HPP92_023700 [Vanilla planifolia]
MEGRDSAPARPPNPAMPYREDCWSEGETSMLIDAWGDRYLDLNRGNLRQKQWQEVAAAVNARPGGGRRPPRTDVQCKNRIDTLKKKYKIEKTKISDGTVSSQWPFYSRLDMLVGSSISAKKTPPSPPLALPLPSHRKGLPLPAAAAAAAAAAVRPVDPLPVREKRQSALPVDDPFFRRNFTAAAAAAAAAADGHSGSSSRSSRSSMERSKSSRERSARGWRRKREETEGDGIRELARSIERLAEIYEKVEGDKQRQMMELEKQRMEFIKGLEFQRMQMFVDTQVQLEKIKRTRRAEAGEIGPSAVLPFLLHPLLPLKL